MLIRGRLAHGTGIPGLRCASSRATCCGAAGLAAHYAAL